MEGPSIIDNSLSDASGAIGLRPIEVDESLSVPARLNLFRSAIINRGAFISR